MVLVSTKKAAALAVAVVGLLFTVPFVAAGEDNLIEAQWNGFVCCAVSTIVITLYPCAQAPGHDLNHDATSEVGLKTIIAVLEWDAAELGAEGLLLRVTHHAGPTEASGTSPLTIHIDEGGWDEDAPIDIEFRVEVLKNSGVTLQQAFTLTYELHHGALAP
jgi:hypothetical protein